MLEDGIFSLMALISGNFCSWLHCKLWRFATPGAWIKAR